MSTEPNSDEIDALLQDLQSIFAYTRKAAAIKLGDIPVSSRRVIEALIAAKNNDQFDEVRDAAVRALMSPVHQTFLQQYPELQSTALRSRQAAFEENSSRPFIRDPLPWYVIWRMALLQPSVDTYDYIARGPDVTVSRARKWIFFSTLIAFPASAFFGIFITLMGRGRQDLLFQVIAASLGQLVLVTAIIAVLGVLGLHISAAATHWSAKRLGGIGDYSVFVFVFAALSAPTSAITWFLGEIPNIGLIESLFSIYAFILLIIAVRAVYRLTVGMSCLATILVPLLIVVVVVIVVMLFRPLTG